MRWSDDIGNCQNCERHQTATGTKRHQIWEIQIGHTTIRLCHECKNNLLDRLQNRPTKTQQRCTVKICYTNWKGKTEMRLIEPLRVHFGSTQWHPQKQWVLDAIDTEKQLERTFAIRDIHYWEEI